MRSTLPWKLVNEEYAAWERWQYEIETQEGEFIGEIEMCEKEDAEFIIKVCNMHNELVECIARNLVAWDTSKDKKEGLLPEVYLCNKVLYKKLTGNEYCFAKAIKDFDIE